MKAITTTLLFFFIFSIPTSLAYHYHKTAGLVNGIYVDYRIPQISLQIVFLIPLIVCIISLARQQKLLPHLPWLTRTGLTATFFTLLFQTVIAAIQLITQHSVTGYLPFGEVNLSSPLVAKGVNLAGALYKLPYGTTVHPNILAGAAALFLLILILSHRLTRLGLVVSCFATFLVIVAAQSLTAALALAISLTIYFSQRLIPPQLSRGALLAIPLTSLLLFSSHSLLTSSNPSLQRRAQLQQIATHMIVAHPLSGIGWNNFTRDQEGYGYVSSTVRFLQPVHNIWLLLVAELGIGGWLLVSLFIFVLFHSPKQYLPLLAFYFVLSSFDHYLLTLTTGRMLLILGLMWITGDLFHRRGIIHPTRSRSSIG